MILPITIRSIFIGIRQCLVVVCCLFNLVSDANNTLINDVDSVPKRFAVNAAKLCQEKNFDLAKSEIELALLQKDEALEAYTWYTRGFIYKEIYKHVESENRQSNSREIAVESFLKARMLNLEKSESNNDAALRYLASTYFKDALASAAVIQSTSDNEAEKVFSKYLSILKEIGSNENTLKSSHAFFKAKGQRFLDLWMADRCNKDFLTATIDALSKACQMDAEDCTTPYNVAVIHYNIGVNSSDNFSRCFDESERASHLQIATSELKTLNTRCGDTREIVTALLNLNRFTLNDGEAMIYELKLKKILEGE